MPTQKMPPGLAAFQQALHGVHADSGHFIMFDMFDMFDHFIRRVRDLLRT